MGNSSETNNNKVNNSETNPCAVCSARKMPVCMCKNSGGGGDTPATTSIGSTRGEASQQKTVSMCTMLEGSSAWQESSHDDLTFDSKSISTPCSISLKLASNTLEFSGPKSSCKEDNEKLDQYYSLIKEEFNEFKNELVAQDIPFNGNISLSGNELVIDIPNQNQFDVFAMRLMSTNLIPVNNNYLLENKEHFEPSQEGSSHDKTSSYQSPNPFDTSKGPQP